MEIKVIKNGNEALAQTIFKGKVVTVEKMFGKYFMTKGNLMYGEGIKEIPKTLNKVYIELINAIEKN